MGRKPATREIKSETISFRVTKRNYLKILKRLDKSEEDDLSSYALNALMDRVKREEEENAGENKAI